MSEITQLYAYTIYVMYMYNVFVDVYYSIYIYLIYGPIGLNIHLDLRKKDRISSI